MALPVRVVPFFLIIILIMIRTGIFREPETGFFSRFTPRLKSEAELKANLRKIPDNILRDIGAKLYPLINLTWGYVGTICDLCKQMRLCETKKLVREIKELKRSYDQFRQPCMGDLETAQESEMGEWVEETFTADFDRLFNGVDQVASKVSLDMNQRLLTVAVHQCLTLIEAIKKYARFCDGLIRQQGAWVCDYCMVQSDFLRMIELVRKFPSAKDERFLPVREMSSNIIVNRLHELEVGSEKDRLWLTKRN